MKDPKKEMTPKEVDEGNTTNSFQINPNKKVLNIIYKVYKTVLSPLLGNFGHHCRFYPSCSDYAYQAIEKYGWLRGGVKAIWRVLRCNPYNKHHGHDPLD